MKILLIPIFIFISTAYGQETTSYNSKILDNINKSLKENDTGSAAYLAQKFNDDTIIIISLLRINGMLLKHASSRLRKNKDVVPTAVKQNGLAIEFAYKTLKYDKEIIFEAAKENIEALQFISTKFTKDREFILHILENSKQIN